MSNLVLVGQLGAPHGIKGEVRIKSYTQDPLAIADFATLVAKNTARADAEPFAIKITKARLSKSMVIAKIQDINSRNEIEPLNGLELFVEREEIVEPDDEDEFLIADLEGLNLILEDGSTFGRLITIENFGADDVMQIETKAGKSTYLPFTRAILPKVDIAAGEGTLVPPGEVIVQPGTESNADEDPE